MNRWLTLAAIALLVAACATDIRVEPQGEGRYALSVDNDYMTRVQGAEDLLAKKAEALCPDGYERLKRKSIHNRHGGMTEQIAWEIQCS